MYNSAMTNVFATTVQFYTHHPFKGLPKLDKRFLNIAKAEDGLRYSRKKSVPGSVSRYSHDCKIVSAMTKSRPYRPSLILGSVVTDQS